MTDEIKYTGYGNWVPVSKKMPPRNEFSFSDKPRYSDKLWLTYISNLTKNREVAIGFYDFDEEKFISNEFWTSEKPKVLAWKFFVYEKAYEGDE